MPAGQPLSELRIDPYTDVNFSFDEEEPNRPWKKIALALLLFIVGVTLVLTGLGMHFSGKRRGADIPLFVIGSLCFIPGFYYTRIAYLTWRGQKGFTLNLIPDI